MTSNLRKAIHALEKGDFVILTDKNREHEADLILYGPLVNPEKINFMIEKTSGVIVVPMSDERLKELELPQMVTNNTERYQTAFTISVDAAKNTTSGVSANDRTETILTLSNPDSKPEDLRRPGHIFPLRSHPDGLKSRKGHTEASIDLAKIAGLQPIMVICEMLGSSGNIMNAEEAFAFHKTYNFPIIDISEVVDYVDIHGLSPLSEIEEPLHV